MDAYFYLFVVIIVIAALIYEAYKRKLQTQVKLQELELKKLEIEKGALSSSQTDDLKEK